MRSRDNLRALVIYEIGQTLYPDDFPVTHIPSAALLDRLGRDLQTLALVPLI